MNLLGWLRRHERGPGDTPTRAEFDALQRAVEELDSVQLARELEWKGIRDQLRRMLGRLDAHKQRDKQREDDEDGTQTLRAALRAKYPHLSNGGE